jgi:hypothetical protein
MSNFQEPWQVKKPGLLARAVAVIKKSNARPEEGAIEVRVPSTKSSTTLLPNKLLRGGSVPVVGESFNSDTFQRLYTLTSGDVRDPIINTATLKIDPTNQHSRSGKAVAVFINGQKVGHIAERVCEIVFDELEKLGGSADCDCSVYFDTSSGEFRYNSVELQMLLPPTLESNNSGAKVPSLKWGQTLHKVGTFKSSEGSGSLVPALNEGQSLLTSSNFSFIDGQIRVTTVDGQASFISNNLEAPLPFAIPKGNSLYYLDTKVAALGTGEFEISVVASNPIKAENARTGDAVSEAGNRLSSRYELGLPPEGNWWKIKYERSILNSPQSALFVPDSTEHTKYFWACVSQGPGLYSNNGFRGSLYLGDVGKLDWNLNSVPSFWVLVRASLVEGDKNPVFEAAINPDASLKLLPKRPFMPANILTTGTTIVAPRKPATKIIEEEEIELKFSQDFSFESLGEKQITTTGFDFLEQSYLVPALESLGFAFGDSVTKSKTGVLVGGSYFDLLDSGKAKSSAKYGIPIVDVAFLREQLETALENETQYRALCRYETWLASIGLNSPHSWGDESYDFDFQTADVVLIPGAALDERNVFGNISFIGALVGLAESKTVLAGLFGELDGQVLDSIVIRTELSFVQGNSGLVMELHRNGVFLGRTPANQTESLAESAKIYDLNEVWVKIDWKSQSKFTGMFSFFGHEGLRMSEFS